MSHRQIYMDSNASTPVAPEVLAAARPFLADHFGNPSADHWASRGAREAIATARRRVADLLGARPDEIVFTSSGSESNNTVLKGVFARSDGARPHYITTQVEHPSVRDPLAFLERLGADVTAVAVDATGRVDPEDIAAAIRPTTVLVSVMHANNETGTIQPIREVAAVTRAHGVLLHTDAAQTVGKIPVNVDRLGVDFLTVAGHKCYAPKGVGALYVRSGVRFEPLLHGGGHQEGRRASTEGAFLAVALGAASDLARRDPDGGRMQLLQDRFLALLRQRFPGRVVLNGHPTERLPNTVNVSFRGYRGHDLLARLPGVAASTGSACHTGSAGSSPTLRAMGVSEELAAGAIRFSLGRQTVGDDIEVVVRLLEQAMCPAPAVQGGRW